MDVEPSRTPGDGDASFEAEPGHPCDIISSGRCEYCNLRNYEQLVEVSWIPLLEPACGGNLNNCRLYEV